MGADQADLAEAVARQFAQSRLIGAPRRAVDTHQGFEQTQARRRPAARRRNLGAMEIGVAAMEEPAFPRPDRYAAMARVWPRSGINSTSSRVPGSARTASKPNQSSPSSSTGAQFETAEICTER